MTDRSVEQLTNALYGAERRAILAEEATAAAEQRLRTELAEKVRALHSEPFWRGPNQPNVDRAAVLDLLLLGGGGDVGVPLRAIDGVGREVSVQRGQGVAVGQPPASRDATPSGTGKPVAAPGDARPALGASTLRWHEGSVTHPSTPPASPRQGEPVDVERLARLRRDFVAVAEQRNEAQAELLRLRNAQIVARYWLDEIMASDALRATGMSHPVAMVLAALDGETDPVQMGIPSEEYARRSAALSEPAEAGEPA